MKLERNATVFDTYRPFLCLPIRGGHSCKVNNKRHGNLIFFVTFFNPVTLIVVFGKIIAIERFTMRHDITGFWRVKDQNFHVLCEH